NSLLMMSTARSTSSRVYAAPHPHAVLVEDEQRVAENVQRRHGTVARGGVEDRVCLEMVRLIRLRIIQSRYVFRVPSGENAVAVGVTHNEPAPLDGRQVIVWLVNRLYFLHGVAVVDPVALAVYEVQFVLQKEVAHLLASHRRQRFCGVSLVLPYPAQLVANNGQQPLFPVVPR